MKLFEASIEKINDSNTPEIIVKLRFPEALDLLNWARKEDIKFSPEEIEYIMQSERNREFVSKFLDGIK